MSLYSERILIDGDDFLVADDRQRSFVNVGHVASDDQRRLRKSPQREMSDVLGGAHATVADLTAKAQGDTDNNK
jgi:hypothetical protein